MYIHLMKTSNLKKSCAHKFSKLSNVFLMFCLFILLSGCSQEDERSCCLSRRYNVFKLTDNFIVVIVINLHK